METNVKIFRINDYEWWAGESLEAIRAEAICQGYTPDDPDEGFDNPRELTAAELLQHQFRDCPQEALPPNDVNFISFRGHLNAMIAAGQKFPCAFACTEY